MAAKCSGSRRRDHKGRILRTGESQRADLTYQYRYTDSSGTRHYIYNPDLHALREEVKHIQVKLSMGIDYAKGNITVLELAKKYIGLKELGVKRNTRLCYAKVVRCLERSCLAKMKIRDVKMSDVKQWFIDLSNEGLSRSVLKQIRGIMRPAFEMALQEDAVHKNPFNFTIDFVPDTTQSRNALTREQQLRLLEFARTDPLSERSYLFIVILLGTGMRAGELCGLTFDDLGFVHRRIFIRRQLMRHPSGGRYVETPKSKHSTRIIPMSDSVYACLRHAISVRGVPDVEPVVDGVTGFVFLNTRNDPMISMYVSKSIWQTVDRYNRQHEDQLPHTTAHNLRHSFCTNLIDAGMNPKNVQYLMGHASITVTMNVYAHSSSEKAELDFLRVASTLD